MKFFKGIIFVLISMSVNLSMARDLCPDGDLVTEVLDNGVTIAVYKNQEPPNRLSMRLLVRRGSAAETEQERGLAHFIEHMAFNGTRNFPSGDMVEYFQRLGMAFGADTNAHTSFTETVYKLDIPDVSDKLVTDGIRLLRDYADGILFNEKFIENERGVIEAEKNARDNHSYRKAVAELKFLFDGTRYADRMPIGELSVIRGAQRADFVNFYKSNYRPENMVLVVVGDIDPKKILALGREYFSSMRPDENFKKREVDLGKIQVSNSDFNFSCEKLDLSSASYKSANDPVASASLSFSKMSQKNNKEEDFIRVARLKFISDLLSARGQKISQMSGAKILSGTADIISMDGAIDSFCVNVEAPSSKINDALLDMFRLFLSLDNITDAELDVAKKKSLDLAESALKSKASRKNKFIANAIVSAYSDGEVFTSSETDLKLTKKAIENFDAKAAKALLKEFLSGTKAKVFISDASVPEGKDLDSMVENATTTARRSMYPSEFFKVNELTFASYGAFGKIVERAEIKDLGIVSLSFENGVKVNLKCTDFDRDNIRMRITFGEGMLALPSPEYYMFASSLIDGGTKWQTSSEIAAATFPLKMSMSLSVAGNFMTMNGASSQKDFSTMLKLASTYFSDAGFREDGIDITRKNAEAAYRDYESNPRARLNFIAGELSESSLAKLPGSFVEFKKLTMKDAKKWLKPMLEKSYMEISIVGDFDVAQTEKLLAETFGALPKRDSIREGGAYASVRFKPVGASVESNYKSDGEPISIAGRMWKSCGREDIVKMRVASILGEILDDVLRKDVREKQGKVYSPFAYNNSSIWIKDTGFVYAMTLVAPEFNVELGKAIEKCGSQVAKEITLDQFERAKIPLLKAVEANLRNNIYWLDAVLNLSQLNPERLEMARTIKSGYSAITLEQVRELAREVFAQPPYSFSIMPK